mgnify:CR=1 FL=1
MEDGVQGGSSVHAVSAVNAILIPNGSITPFNSTSKAWLSFFSTHSRAASIYNLITSTHSYAELVDEEGEVVHRPVLQQLLLCAGKQFRSAGHSKHEQSLVRLLVLIEEELDLVRLLEDRQQQDVLVVAQLHLVLLNGLVCVVREGDRQIEQQVVCGHNALNSQITQFVDGIQRTGILPSLSFDDSVGRRRLFGENVERVDEVGAVMFHD